METVERSPSRTASLGEEGIHPVGLGPDPPCHPRLDLHPASEAGDGSVLVSYYLLWQFWFLARSKTMTWTGTARFFAVGAVTIAPLSALIIYFTHGLFAEGALSRAGGLEQ